MLNRNHIVQNENLAGKSKSSPPPPPPPQSPPLSPSPNPSPSHEFSFTISLHHHNCTSAPPQLDLAPADDIFFHGHLLPLDNLQSFRKAKPNDDYYNPTNINSKPKPTFPSLVGLTKWLKKSDDEQRKKKSFDSSCCWKKMGKFVFFKCEKEKEEGELRRRHCSFSGKANDSREGSTRWQWRGEVSAPATVWTSPTCGGVHVASSAVAGTSSEESTMVELQNAVQAAIAHCKSSIAGKEEKFS